MEDDRVAILEAQLAQAKLIAEEADKKYEEVRREQNLRSTSGDGREGCTRLSHNFQKRRCFERNNFVSVAQLHNILSHVFNTQSDNPSSLKLFLHDSSFPRPHLPVVVAHLPTLLSSNCSDFPPGPPGSSSGICLQ